MWCPHIYLPAEQECGMSSEIIRAAQRGEYYLVLRLARQRQGWTQAALARRVGVDQTAISRLETGKQPFNDVRLVRRLAQAFDMPERIFSLADSGPTVEVTHHEGDEDVRRRQMLTAAGLAVIGVTLGPPPETPHRVTTAHAHRIRQLTEQHRQVVYQRGASRRVRDAITDLLHHTTTLLPQVGAEPIRTELLDVMGDLAGLAAYAYRDLGSHGLAQQHYLLAIQAAKAAGNDPLIGHLVVRMAGQHIELVRPVEVHNYLRAARATATRFSPSELSNQSAIAAWAHAQTGDYQSMRRDVCLAEEHFARRDDTSPTGWGRRWQLRYTAEAELYSITGAAYTELAQHDARHAEEAIARLSRALKIRGPGFARNATLDVISLAEAHLARHDIHEAVACATRAVRMTGGGTSLRVRERLTGLTEQLQPHQCRSEVADLLHAAGRV